MNKLFGVSAFLIIVECYHKQLYFLPAHWNRMPLGNLNPYWSLSHQPVRVLCYDDLQKPSYRFGSRQIEFAIMQKTNGALDGVLQIGFLDIDCDYPWMSQEDAQAHRRTMIIRHYLDNIYTVSRQYLDNI